MKKVFITGLTGFAGSHLAEYLVSLGMFEVVGTYLSEPSLVNVSKIKDKIRLIQLDLVDKGKVSEAIAHEEPDWIMHLAALAAVGKSFSDPIGTITNNVAAEVNILEAVRQTKINPRILITSSADIYGLVNPADLPMDEETPMRPGNPYAVSKIAQDYLALQYFISYKMDIVRVRPFNHIGPRQALGFAVSDFAKRIVDIEKGKSPPVLKIGNLDAKRDFTDVRDMVRAYTQLMDKGVACEVYNVGSGISHAMKEIVEMMKGLSTVQFSLEQDPALMRPSDNPELRSDNNKFAALTGWKPEISLEQSLKDILKYWKEME